MTVLFKFPLKLIILISLGLMGALFPRSPLKAAEEITFVYTPLSQSLEVKSLELFAKEGIINQDLKFYLDILDATDIEKNILQLALNRKVDINPILVSRVLHTDEGERLLESFGEIVHLPRGTNSKFALRSAIVRAAFEAEGLTLLNVLQNLSIDIQVDLNRLLRFARSGEIILEGTQTFIREVEQLSQQEAQSFRRINYENKADLRQKTDAIVQHQTWFLDDTERQRKFYASIYRPETFPSEKIPIVIISHGLASEPAGHDTLAKHLASYGFLVVSPQHVESDRQHLENFIEGIEKEVSELDEFINRPLDITFVLDELERRNLTEFSGRLDTNHVGIYGHSYGGYTALSVAGASPAPNYQTLTQDCGAEWGIFNNALLLQCRALQLAPQQFTFRDERIQAVMAANPVNASIFGSSGLDNLQIPTAIIAGSYDPATPFIFEQVRSFPWIGSKDKYLILEEGQVHVDISKLDLGISQLIDRLPSLNLPSPELLNSYSEAIALSFFQVYIANNETYTDYLNPAYANYLSEGEEFKAFMITEKSTDTLESEIAKFRAKHGIRNE